MTNKTKECEPIEVGKIYPLEKFKTITGLGDAAMRSIRRKARVREIEIVKYEGGRAFVRGADWHRYLDEESEQ